MTRSNMMGLVVDATAERLALEGFRLAGQNAADQESWTLWKSNDLDFHFDMGLLEGLKGGTFYTLVEPTGTGPAEHLRGAPVAGDRRLRARLQPAPQGRRAEVVGGRLDRPAQRHPRPESRGRGVAVQVRGGPAPRRGAGGARPVAAPRGAGESWPARNPLGEVALTECPNNPTLLGGGVSEIADVIDVQDRINKTIADRLMTQDYGAFPQKWATGYPEEDAHGQRGAADRHRPGPGGHHRRAETRFGQWETAPMDPYSSAKREDAKDIASRTRVPAQYLLGEMSNVNGETLKASESGLVAKCRQRTRSFGQGAVGTIWLARRAAGLPDADARMEAIWRNTEFRTEGETMDAAVKGVQTGIYDVRYAREYVGMSQTAIAEMERREAAADPVVAQIARTFQAGAGMTGGGTAAGQ
jgi:hypothetical protein